MEARNITIVNSRTQTRTDFTSEAETLGELKADMEKNGIDYGDMAFYEGISKTTLEGDESVLPSNLPWKGARTNNLAIRLTERQNKIKNGMVMNRNEAYKYIKDNNLQETVAKKFGDNFTRCKTVQLVDFCNKHSQPVVKKKAACRAISKGVLTKNSVVQTEKCRNVTCGDKLTNLLVAKGYISAKEAETGKPDVVTSVNLSEKDIKDMFSHLDD